MEIVFQQIVLKQWRSNKQNPTRITNKKAIHAYIPFTNLVPFTTINSKWIIGLYIKLKTIKFIENIGKKSRWSWVWRWIFRYTIKCTIHDKIFKLPFVQNFKLSEKYTIKIKNNQNIRRKHLQIHIVWRTGIQNI